MATELYAAGRIIGNKCFDENLNRPLPTVTYVPSFVPRGARSAPGSPVRPGEPGGARGSPVVPRGARWCPVVPSESGPPAAPCLAGLETTPEHHRRCPRRRIVSLPRIVDTAHELWTLMNRSEAGKDNTRPPSRVIIICIAVLYTCSCRGGTRNEVKPTGSPDTD